MRKSLPTILTIASLAFPAFAASLEPQPNAEPYSDLNSFVGKPARCKLKPEEANWLREQIRQGNLRVVNPEDIKAWEELAKQKKRPNATVADCGRTFVILKEMTIPKEKISGFPINFVLLANITFPRLNTPSAIYDLKNGGLFHAGTCDDGKRRGVGKSSRDCH